MGFKLMALADTLDIVTGPPGATIIPTLRQEEHISGLFSLIWHLRRS